MVKSESRSRSRGRGDGGRGDGGDRGGRDKGIVVDGMCEKRALALVGNLPLSIMECTVTDKEKMWAIKCAKLAV